MNCGHWTLVKDDTRPDNGEWMETGQWTLETGQGTITTGSWILDS